MYIARFTEKSGGRKGGDAMDWTIVGVGVMLLVPRRKAISPGGKSSGGYSIRFYFLIYTAIR